MDPRFALAVVEALKTALFTRSGDTPAAIRQVDRGLAALLTADVAAFEQAFDALPIAQASWPVNDVALRRALADVTRHFERKASVVDGAALATALFAAAQLLVPVAQGYSAFLLCEVVYMLGEDDDRDRVEATRLQLSLASPADESEFNLRAWRHAVEACRHSVARSAGWLEAIDAVELALLVPPPEVERQASVMKSLHRVLRTVAHTPLEALVLAYWCQGPLGAFDRETLGQWIRRYLGQIGDLPQGLDPASIAGEDVLLALRELAAIRSQLHIDEARLELTRSSQAAAPPEIAWSDHTLRHVRYLDAVPLRRSLLVDLDRTADTVMELVHELTHAYTLLGPLGWARTACRAAIVYLEMMLHDLSPDGRARPEGEDLLERAPRTSIDVPSTGGALLDMVCDAQLTALWRSKVLQAAWLPWLEGLAVYVELTADPRDDPHGILAPHAALRSLVDLQGERRTGESLEDHSRRLNQALAEEFDSYYSAALGRNARLRHIGYLRSAHLPHVYLLGYLVVRSVVARWEKTLGRRVAPFVAARLLLDATRNGTLDAVPSFDADDLDEFEARARAGMQHFAARLAALPAGVLSEYLVPIASDDAPPRRHRWRDTVPLPMPPDEGTRADDPLLRTRHDAFRAATVDLALRGALFSATLEEQDLDAAIAARGPELLSLFDNLHAQSSLVAVGRCQTRVVVLDAARGRMMLAPRTYAGLGQPLADDDLNRMRYGVRVVNLAGGAGELQRLLDACRRHRSARVLCTRVIDMVGLVGTPMEAPCTSYVHFGLGDWQLLSVDDTMQPIDSRFARFASLVRLRVDPPALLSDEGRTLDDPAFMVGRLRGDLRDSEAACRLNALDVEGLARAHAADLAAAAFAQMPDAIDAAATELLGAPSEHPAVADYLTGHQGAARVQRALATTLGALVFDAGSLSRVRAFEIATHGGAS